MTFMAFGGYIVGGAILNSITANDAANKQENATYAGIDEQRRQYDQTRADFAPWRETGQRALTSLEGDIGRMPTAEEVQADPGYQFGLDQGLKSLDRRMAAIGGRRSGAALMGATRYAQGYAGNAYNAAYQRRQDRLNRLAALAGIGQTATGSSAAAGANATNAITGLIASQGDSAAAAKLYQGNLWSDAANQAAAMYQRNQRPGTAQRPYQPPAYGGGWSASPWTWQGQGGAMDYGSYAPNLGPYENYGYFGGP